jgi:hypothetical protein
MANTRLQKLLHTKCNELEDKVLLDGYNQTFVRDVSYTITTRVIGCCHYFVFEKVDVNE